MQSSHFHICPNQSSHRVVRAHTSQGCSWEQWQLCPSPAAALKQHSPWDTLELPSPKAPTQRSSAEKQISCGHLLCEQPCKPIPTGHTNYSQDTAPRLPKSSLNAHIYTAMMVWERVYVLRHKVFLTLVSACTITIPSQASHVFLCRLVVDAIYFN